jgi:hypothetical protein
VVHSTGLQVSADALKSRQQRVGAAFQQLKVGSRVLHAEHVANKQDTYIDILGKISCYI